MNYGVYGIDLAYTNFYGQNQALLNYYIATKKLAEGLNIEETFNEFANSFNKNSSNKDSIVQIVDKAYNETDAYLKKNERYLAASHVLAGVLIEVNFISLSLLQDMKQDTSNEKLFEKIYNEKLYIYYLVKLFEEYTDRDSKALLSELQSFKKMYDDSVKSPGDLTSENITKVLSQLSSIRAKLVK